jgi:hypothetical protein
LVFPSLPFLRTSEIPKYQKLKILGCDGEEGRNPSHDDQSLEEREIANSNRSFPFYRVELDGHS